jgi:membrane protein involved in colicin uptake
MGMIFFLEFVQQQQQNQAKKSTRNRKKRPPTVADKLTYTSSYQTMLIKFIEMW